MSQNTANPAPVRPVDEVYTEFVRAGSGRQSEEWVRLIREMAAHGPIADLGRNRFAVIGFDEVDEALKNPEILMIDFEHQQRFLEDVPDSVSVRAFADTMLMQNPPNHTRMRKVFRRAFTPRRLNLLRDSIEAIVDRALDALPEKTGPDGTVDLVDNFTYRIPIQVISDLIGIPEADRPRVEADAELFIKATELGDGDDGERRRLADEGTERLQEYFRGFIATRRAEPAEDLASEAIANSDAMEDPLTENEMTSNFLLLYFAGFFTTVHLIGNGIVHGDRERHWMPLVASGGTVADGYVGETLRAWPSILFTARRVADPVELGGTTLPADSDLVVMTSVANRDPAVYPDPDLFDPYRDHGRVLTFGGGAHFCIGAALAKMEARVALSKLWERHPDMRLSGEPELAQVPGVIGYNRLPARL
ncbi:cytochrome P450 [Salininema proteolyticum]|uniref:Cytochrome P450 n=1 Tax=Salininema proteolyticum TaxID=1607685 RepID=A0ABV8TTY2_9ACTN